MAHQVVLAAMLRKCVDDLQYTRWHQSCIQNVSLSVGPGFSLL